MTLYMMLTGVLAVSGLLLFALSAHAASARGRARQLRHDRRHNLSPTKFWRTALLNAVLSTTLIYACAYLFSAQLFHEGVVAPTRALGEGAAILLVYDFFYYLVHRFPFHEWRILRSVHAVHHVIRNPHAIDSLYMHPVENLMGLSLLWLCTAAVRLVVGPISVYSFGVVFLIYSLLNIVVHAGVQLSFPLGTYLATRHNAHHADMRAKNYASVTPLFDILFGTEEGRTS